MSGEICIDDRAALRPGVKLKDAELVGFPYVLVVGKASYNLETLSPSPSTKLQLLMSTSTLMKGLS